MLGALWYDKVDVEKEWDCWVVPKIGHERVGMRSIARVQFWKKMLILYCTCTLMYANMYADNDLYSRYVGNVIPMRGEEM